MLRKYYENLLEHCSTEVAFTALANVVAKEKGDNMATYFLAETLKYLYLAFANQDMYNLESVVFSTEAHPFLKAALVPEMIKKNLNIR